MGTALAGTSTAHEKFHTGKVELPDGRHVDFATARTEYYQYPAALPTAEHSSVREDLYRRDFTINAMAMQLNGDEPGRLLDPFGGGRDLVEGIIRVLHNLSFVEDPTRMLRAVRFEARFGFRMAERTEELARHALQDGPARPRLRRAHPRGVPSSFSPAPIPRWACAAWMNWACSPRWSRPGPSAAPRPSMGAWKRRSPGQSANPPSPPTCPTTPTSGCCSSSPG